MGRIRNHLHHHGRFYAAGVLGILIFMVGGNLGEPARSLAAGDAFFALYLASEVYTIYRIDSEGLRNRAAREDEGIFIVILIALAVIVISSLGIFTVLRAKHAPSPLALGLAVAAAPLGWTSLHTIAAFHYANLYYRRKSDANNAQSPHGLDFKDTKHPGVWDFLYFSFTVGMTSQTSDTDVLDTRMRQATLGHSVVSFFYNTAIIAMAVNAVVSLAS